MESDIVVVIENDESGEENKTEMKEPNNLNSLNNLNDFNKTDKNELRDRYYTHQHVIKTTTHPRHYTTNEELYDETKIQNLQKRYEPRQERKNSNEHFNEKTGNRNSNETIEERNEIYVNTFKNENKIEFKINNTNNSGENSSGGNLPDNSRKHISSTTLPNYVNLNPPSNTNNLNFVPNSSNLPNTIPKIQNIQNIQTNQNNQNNLPLPQNVSSNQMQNNMNNINNFNNNPNIIATPHNANSLDLSDFIVNIEESEKNINIHNMPNIPESEINSIARSLKNPVQSNARFNKQIVVLNNTEERKEDIEINGDNPRRDIRQVNPRQKKPSQPNMIVSENDNLLFFFVNPSAGIGQGRYLINMGVKKVEFTDTLRCTAHIFNMNDEANLELGIATLRNELERISLARVVIGGGDGSVLAMVEKLTWNGIDLNRIILGVLPFGRSNDLSRALGWGGKMDITSDMAKFKLIVRDLAEATSVFVDLWETKLICDEQEGAIISFDHNTQCKKKLLTKTSMKRLFINYFSLGFDARVGFGFNKTRTQYRLVNFLTYFWEALKKTFCRHSLPLKGFLDSFSVVKVDEDIFDLNVTNQNDTLREMEGPKDLVFQNADNIGNVGRVGSDVARDSKGSDNLQQIVLKGEPVALVCQNTNYFIGGPPDLWRNSRDNFGLQVHEEINVKDKKAVEEKDEKDKEIFRNVFRNNEQKLNDQKLEFFTYSSKWKLGCCKVLPGDADKVYHGKGPIVINFKDLPQASQSDKYNRVYLNIDAEYFQIDKPKSLHVRIAKNFNGGKLKFLQKL